MRRTDPAKLRKMYDPSCCVMVWASYEERCLNLVRHLTQIGPVSGIIAHLDEGEYDIAGNLSILKTLFDANLVCEDLYDRRKPYNNLRMLFAAVERLRQFDVAFIDITSFPRDILLVLLLVIWKGEKSQRAYFVYNVAADYSVNERLESKWLSRGVSSVSPILGFRGRMLPGRPLAVLALLGLDGDRLKLIADRIEPSKLVLGIGGTSDNERKWLYERNLSLYEELSSLTHVVGRFEFDCGSVEHTRKMCRQWISKLDGNNIALLPLNNKLSTLACGIVAIENRNVQICHGSALLYNMDGYSKGSDEFYISSVAELFESDLS